MKKVVWVLAFVATMSLQAKVEQMICYSQGSCTDKYSYAVLGKDVKLCGPCSEKTLKEMNDEGWELIQVITGLSNSFGMVFTKKENIAPKKATK